MQIVDPADRESTLVPHGYDDSMQVYVYNDGAQESSPGQIQFTLSPGFELGPKGIRNGDGEVVVGHAVTCDQSGNTWTCPMPALANEDIGPTLGGFFSFDVHAPADAPVGLGGSFTPTILPAGTGDTDPTNNTETVHFAVGPVAALTYQLSVDRSHVQVGDDFVITVSVTNHGPDTGTDEHMDLFLYVPDFGQGSPSAYARLDDADGGLTYGDDTGVTFEHLTILAGQTFTAHLRYTALRASANTKEYLNRQFSETAFDPSVVPCWVTGIRAQCPLITAYFDLDPASSISSDESVAPVRPHHAVRATPRPTTTAAVTPTAALPTRHVAATGLAYTGAPIRSTFMVGMMLLLGGAILISGAVNQRRWRRPSPRHRDGEVTPPTSTPPNTSARWTL